MLKDIFDDRKLADETEATCFAGALGADQRICFVDLADKVKTSASITP